MQIGFFLIENRQRTNIYEEELIFACGNTRGLPATGLLITEVGPGWNYPYSSLPYSPVDIKEADNAWSPPGNAGDTYKPGNKVQFTPLRAEQCYWAGQHTHIIGNVDNAPYLGSTPSPVGWDKVMAMILPCLKSRMINLELQPFQKRARYKRSSTR